MKIILGLFFCATFLSNLSQAAIYTVSGAIDPIQATTNPGNIGTGTGSISGTYDNITNVLDYTIIWSGLSGPITVAHFHVGAPGVPGGVALTIPAAAAAAGSISDTPTLSATNESDLLAGNWYVNLHTAAFGAGEIRGQVDVTLVPEPSSSFLALIAMGAFFIYRKR